MYLFQCGQWETNTVVLWFQGLPLLWGVQTPLLQAGGGHSETQNGWVRSTVSLFSSDTAAHQTGMERSGDQDWQDPVQLEASAGNWEASQRIVQLQQSPSPTALNEAAL